MSRYSLSEALLEKLTGRQKDLSKPQNPNDYIENMLHNDPISSVDVYFRRLGDHGYSHRRIYANT